MEECPRHGLFSFTYIAEKETFVRHEAREHEAIERFGTQIVHSQGAPLDEYGL